MEGHSNTEDCGPLEERRRSRRGSLLDAVELCKTWVKRWQISEISESESKIGWFTTSNHQVFNKMWISYPWNFLGDKKIHNLNRSLAVKNPENHPKNNSWCTDRPQNVEVISWSLKKMRLGSREAAFIVRVKLTGAVSPVVRSVDMFDPLLFFCVWGGDTRNSWRDGLNCTFFTIPYNPNIMPTGYRSWISPSTTRWQDSCWTIFLWNSCRFCGCLEPAYISTPD